MRRILLSCAVSYRVAGCIRLSSVDLVTQPLALCRQWGPTFCKHDRQTCRQAPVRFTFCNVFPDSVPVWVSLRGCLEDYKAAAVY